MLKLSDPEPTYELPPNILDLEADQPVGDPVPAIGDTQWPRIVVGTATLGAGIYNTQELVNSPEPFRAVRLALRYGMRGFDTAAYYGTSEIVLGAILKELADEFPRESYRIATKCGRYGTPAEDFDYSRETIRKTVERSLKRLGTTYLDVMYLHDTEYVCTPVWPADPTGDPVKVLEDPVLSAAWGLRPEDRDRVHGDGDQKIVDAFDELRKMKEEGHIRAIGLTGYPLPVLLRLGRLVAAKGNPPDVIMSYAHWNLQNHTFEKFAPLFREAGAKQLLTASPLNMGYLTASPPSWHPAGAEMIAFKNEKLLPMCSSWPGGLPNVALGYALTNTSGAMAGVPLVIGFSRPSEVHEAVAAWRQVENGSSESRKAQEAAVVAALREAGWENHSWKSPP
ncbi:aldo/keto reductase family protein [Ceratobasidium sp. AG-Ba]|nr:aldo/keto reductase family protein [Ceratobasidium sp. AG-Ba]